MSLKRLFRKVKGKLIRTPKERRVAKMQAKSEAERRATEKAQFKAADIDIESKARAAGLRAERSEAIKVAEERGRARARRPRGFAAVTSGLQSVAQGAQTLSTGLSKMQGQPSRRMTTRSRQDELSNILGSKPAPVVRRVTRRKKRRRRSRRRTTRQAPPSRPGILDFKL